MDEVNIGLLIKQRRVEIGLKQYELATKLGISRSYLSDIETGRYYPSSKLLLKINNLIGIFIFNLNDGNTIHKVS